VNLVTGGLIEIADYNALALEVNRLFSDNTVGLDWSASNIILDLTVSGATLTAGTPVPLSVSGLNLNSSDFIVVTVNTGTGWRTLLPTIGYSLNYTPNPETITFTTSYVVTNQIRVYLRQAHRFGWGQQASVYPISAGDPILADEQTLQAYLEANVNNLIDKTNIMEVRTDGPSVLTRVAQGALIYATDKTTISSTIAADITSGSNYWQNSEATTLPSVFTFTRTTPWTTRLTATSRWSWDNYNDMRYFFNTGGEARAAIVTSGSSMNQGYVNWNQVANDMGTLIMNYDTTFQSGINGTSAGLGIYELTSDYQTVFTSGSPRVPVDNAGNFDAYSGYEDLVILWQARIVEDAPSMGNISLDIRAILDDRSFAQTFEGNIAYQSGYTRANDATDNSAVFSVDDYLPTITQQENFTTAGVGPAPGNDPNTTVTPPPAVNVVASPADAVVPSLGDTPLVPGQIIPPGEDPGIVIDTGDVIVNISVELIGNNGVVRYDTGQTIYVAPGELFAPTETLSLNGNGAVGLTARLKISFTPEYDVNVSTNVSNVRFRISDIDGITPNERVDYVAYNANNVEVPITYTLGSNLVRSGNTITATANAPGSGAGAAQPSNSCLATIVGPVARIEAVYSNRNTGNPTHTVWLSDIVFNTIPI
jgi:hypothetical protein